MTSPKFTTFSEYLKIHPLFSFDSNSINEASQEYADSKGIARYKMPQILSSDLKEFLKFLDKSDIKHSKEVVKVSELKPTQREYNPDKVKGLKSAPMSILTLPIIKSNDNYIMDGTHRYQALLELDKNNTINTISIDLNIDDLLKKAFSFPKTFTKGINECKYR